MVKTTKTAPMIDARKIVEECVEFARRNGGRVCQVVQRDQTNRWTGRMLFVHPLCYCPTSILSEDHTKPAFMLDISLAGVGLWCCEALGEGTVVYVHLPLLDGNSDWVKGSVIYCHPEVGHYRVGVTFIFEQE